MIGSIITILGLVGVLTPQQVEDLRKAVEEFSGQWSAMMAAAVIVMASGMTIYRALLKSRSDKAAVSAQQIDARLPASEPVIIKTPAGVPDIVVSKNATVTR
ncbi:hypothetical protein [Mesorhizobium sp. DCY119]|uniref:hypothetical protein n=1 Tax=Mesorhizobium sp. DCY119 TaxID=2108445 RepID=UPI0010584A48|nr:hypothetical protein [Mesorhizobium sp. DCY119]